MFDNRTPFAYPTANEKLPESAKRPTNNVQQARYKSPAYGQTRTSRLAETCERDPQKPTATPASHRNDKRLAGMHAEARKRFMENRGIASTEQSDESARSRFAVLRLEMSGTERWALDVTRALLVSYGFQIYRSLAHANSGHVTVSCDVCYCCSAVKEAVQEIALALPRGSRITVVAHGLFN